MGLEPLDIHMQKTEPWVNLTPCKKSKYSIALQVKCKTIIPLEENRRKSDSPWVRQKLRHTPKANILSSAYLPHTHLLWWRVYPNLSPVFKSHCLLFKFWEFFLYSWYKSFDRNVIWQIFFQLMAEFSFSLTVFQRAKVLNLF